MNIKQLVEQIEGLFTDRMTYMMLLQELAENFYPERADFTVRREHGNEFAGDLMTSYPILIRRDLGDQIGQMLRPTAKEWFKIIPKGGEKAGNEEMRWLENAQLKMRRAMYTRPALFSKAAKEGDHDFATFGQCVMSCRLNRNADNLLYRSWHLRDVVWSENEEGGFGIVARKWKPAARELRTLFGDKVGPEVIKLADKSPFSKVNCLHIVVESDLYDDSAKGRPYWSLYYDQEHKTLLEAIPVWHNEYIIPRWQTVSGSQYAYSPASITALPDARLIQSMTYTLLEAGEKATNPPLIATQDAVRSDVSIYAGGITWVDMDYDEKLGSALRPISQDYRQLPFGQDMINDSRALLAQAFFLNKLNLPQRAPEMTAYEVGQRIQEYIRGALPIFEPMESEYNGGICETTFETLFRAGVFGSPREIPESLQASGVEFEYESPLHDAVEEQLGQKFLETKALIAEAIDVDRGSAYVLDTRTALRASMEGIGIPANWMHPVDEVDRMVKQQSEAEQQAVEMEQVVQSSEAAKNIGAASQNLEMA